MSTMSIIDISDKVDNPLYPTNELQDVSKKNMSTDPLVAKLSSTIIYKELQEKKDKQKQNQTASAYITIFTCMLCVAMSVVVITKILEDGDRTNFYDRLSEPPSTKICKDQIEPHKLKPKLLQSSNSTIQPQIMFTSTETEESLNNSTTETAVNNELIITTSKSYDNADTEDPMDDTNNIPTVEPLEGRLESSANLNFNNVHVLSLCFIVFLIFKF